MAHNTIILNIKEQQSKAGSQTGVVMTVVCPLYAGTCWKCVIRPFECCEYWLATEELLLCKCITGTLLLYEICVKFDISLHTGFVGGANIELIQHSELYEIGLSIRGEQQHCVMSEIMEHWSKSLWTDRSLESLGLEPADPKPELWLDDLDKGGGGSILACQYPPATHDVWVTDFNFGGAKIDFFFDLLLLLNNGEVEML